MDKSWIRLKDRTSDEYVKGIKSFMEVAKTHVDAEQKTLCPCRSCLNKNPKRKLDTIERHLRANGFSPSYQVWVHHGEKINLNDFLPHSNREDEATSSMHHNEETEPDEIFEMIDRLGRPTPIVNGSSGAPVERADANDHPKVTESILGLLEEARRELHPGCSNMSSLNFLVKLMHIKVLNHMSIKAFNMVLKLLNEAFPSGSIPANFYDAKKVLKHLGLGYETIDVCKYDCALFWKEHSKRDDCPVCSEPRYIFHQGKGKKVAQKVLRYFPLNPRLQRLFMSKYTASSMRWHKDRHKDERVETEDILRHPADAKWWKDFDGQYEWFARDPRNVRLGLATDGFNPFGNMSNSYSMWPVILIPYNLPPWMCMKEPYFMMSLLIPGTNAPGKDIDVYLRPLIDELKELWEVGADTFDAFTGKSFQMHAAVILTINDFPAFGNLSGWSTKGYKACPVCNSDSSSQRLRSKIGYLGHRRFLPRGHSWRRSKQFDGKNDLRPPPKELNGDDIDS